jgi:hypothetical protein
VAERWRLTDHAKTRMAEMGVKRQEVLEAIYQAETHYPGSPRRPQGRRLALKGRLAVVYEPFPSKRVITVLWRGIEFTRPDAAPLRNLDNAQKQQIRSVTPGR